MTDAEVEELLHPPRPWPPLSVLAAGGLLLAPPLLVCGYVLLVRQWTDLLVPIVCLAVAGRPGLNLLRGRTEGVGGGLGVVGLVLLLTVGSVAFAVVNGAGPAELVALLPVVSWMVGTGFLLWWPETRRWCGLLPPADDDDE